MAVADKSLISSVDEYRGHNQVRLVNAVRHAGCQIVETRLAGLFREVAFEGNCVGWMTKEEDATVLHMDRFSDPKVLRAVATYIAESSKEAALGQSTDKASEMQAPRPTALAYGHLAQSSFGFAR